MTDYLSRLPLDCGEDISYRITEEYVRSTVIAAVPPAMTPCDIERESEEDEELAKVRTALRTDKWSNVSVKFKHVKDELSRYGQLILRGTWIACPEKMRAQALKDIKVWPK